MDNKINKLPERQKKVYRFNIIDFILIVLIIAAVSVLAYVMLGTNLLTGGENTTILYTIEIDPIRNDFIPSINQIKQGTKIIDSVRSNDIGVIQEVKIADAYSNNTDTETGVVHRKPYPDHSRVTITVKAECKKEKAKYVVNGKTIMVGVQVHFRTPYFVSYGNCIALEEITEDGGVSGNDAAEAETTEKVTDTE